jgi:hypothetical protein
VQISAAQTDIDHKIDNYEMLFQMLKLEPGYTPNENELKLAAIQTMITGMKDKNKAVGLALAPMQTARIDRNNEMYIAAESGYDLSGKVKRYFKAVFGAKSEEYHNVAKFVYKKLVK